MIDIEASDGAAHAAMGETLIAARNDRVSWTAHITGGSSSTIHWLVDGKELPTLPPQPVVAANQSASWTSDGQRHWLRAEVRTSVGTLQLLSNPIFVNWPAKPSRDSNPDNLSTMTDSESALFNRLAVLGKHYCLCKTFSILGTNLLPLSEA